jgi:hypothetical protein
MSTLHESTRSVLLLLAMLSCAEPTMAQEQRLYVGGGIDISTFGTDSWDGSPSLTYTNSTDDAMAAGIAAEGGVFLGRSTAVGAEVNLPLGRSDVTQSHGYFNPYHRLSRYQDASVFGMFHRYVSTGRRVHIGLAAGGGVVFASSLDRVSTCNFDPHIPCGVFGAEEETTRAALGVTVGGDVVIQATRHFSFVPQFRFVWVSRGEPASSSDDVVTLGVDQFVYRAGIGLRARF